MIIHQLGGTINTDKLEILPYLILQKIMMFDEASRGNLYTGDNSAGVLENLNEINPLDNYLTLLHCCNNFLTQDVLTRLSTCQLAIPFLLPNPNDGTITFLLWGMREIIRAWKSINSRGALVSNESRIVNCLAPIVSFYKMGKLQQSKSRIINEVISESGVNFFFNWDCEGGTSKYLFVDGMAELCCYLPSGRKDFTDFYSDIIIFANLRGDAKKHVTQVNFMQKISYMSCILLQENHLNDECLELLEKLKKSPGGVILMFADLKKNQKIKNKKLYQKLSGMHIIELKEKNHAQIRSDIRKIIGEKLRSSSQMDYKRLNECMKTALSCGILTDEDDKEIKDGKKLAEAVMQHIMSNYTKLEIFPLQGPDFWQKWATLDKESHRQHKGDTEAKMKAIRQIQLNLTVKPTPVMKTFLSNLLNHSGNVRVYFVYWLKMFLDDRSRKVLPHLNDVYQNTRTKLQNAKTENKKQPDCKIVTQLTRELKQQNAQLVNASLGLEHFFREMGQIYEARMNTQLKGVSKTLKHEVSSYPQIIAELISEGYAVELMDGDVAHVPITWVLAVIEQLKHQYLQKQNIFVISVLGIQSTGKSTLLNTVFGLRFNVSAGRCTRGAYFRLLSFDPAMLANKSDCNHILVIDTEGLRAPELQYRQQQKHDNELATFVIGLADLTIINIYGETPGEMTDILQTAVHAFIRMKNVNMQLSCHFVHQNVTAVMVDKSIVGRQQFQDWLDDMTKAAAQLEKCDGRYRSFQDVIQFNDEKNVTSFPALWKGDPPMAPVNPGYSFKACELKESLIVAIQSRKNHINFANFQLRVKKLWAAVLQENFLFNFKNTLEVTAYNELDSKYSQWSWDLKHKMLEWQHQARNQIDSCDVSKIDSEVNKCLLEIENDINSTCLKINGSLTEFFEDSERRETLAQWRKETELKLQKLCTDQKDEAKKYCSMLCQNRSSKAKVANIQQKYRQYLREHINALESDTKKLASTAEKREEIFNTKWHQWIEELSQNIKPVAYATSAQMEREIIEILNEKYIAHGNLVLAGLKTRCFPKNYTLKLDITPLHLEPKCTNDSKKPHKMVNDEDFRLANSQTITFLDKVEEWMEGIIKDCQDFSKTLIDINLLAKLQADIEKFNNENSNFFFTTEYQVDIAIIASGYAYKKFDAKLKELAIENDPIEVMNTQKPIFFRTFETQFSEASKDHTAAQNLCNILTKPIKKALFEKLQIEIANSMKLESVHFKKKNYFKVLVMKNLATKRDFELYKIYISNVSISLKYWSKIFVTQHCETITKDKNTVLFDLAKENLEEIIHKIEKIVDSPRSTTTKGASRNSSQHYSIKEWLENFHDKAKIIIAIDFQEMIDMIGVNNIHNLNLFSKQLVKYLKEESEAILTEYENTTASIEKLTESADSPHLELYKSLIGCQEQCPFCKEQCELTKEDHIDFKKPHYTEIHRPSCLGGCTYQIDNKMAFDTCIKLINGNEMFENADTDHKPWYFKNYKKIYRNWQISTESDRTGPKYWRWFIANYKVQLAEWLGAKPTSFEDSWKDITEEDAMSNLDETYGLNTEPQC